MQQAFRSPGQVGRCQVARIQERYGPMRALAWKPKVRGKLFGNPVSLYLGEISFSIYMLQWFVIDNAKLLGLAQLTPAQQIPAIIVTVLLLAMITNEYVERRGGDR